MSMETHPPAFQFYPKDFAGDGIVAAMTTKSVGAYMLLLCKAWYQQPVGTIPDDDRVLAKWSGLSLEEWQECRAEVLAAFKPGDDGRFHQTRMQSEYAKQLAYKAERSKAGKHGVEVREQRRKDRQNIPEAEHKLSISSASVLHEAKSSSPSASPSPNLRNVTGRSAKAGLTGHAGFIASKLPTPKNSHDVRLLRLAGRAVDGHLITENDVATALQGCDGNGVTKPWAMFYSALKKNVAAAGVDLDQIFESLDSQAVAS